MQFLSSDRIYKRISRSTTKDRKPSNDPSDADDVTDSEDSQRVVSPSGCLLSCTKFTIKYMYRYLMKYFSVLTRLLSSRFYGYQAKKHDLIKVSNLIIEMFLVILMFQNLACYSKIYSTGHKPLDLSFIPTYIYTLLVNGL